MIGTTIGHYRITDKLGHGGMGEVYRAEDTKLKREVALKVLPHDLSDDTERLTRFQREAEMVAALNHPNIVTIFSVEEDNGVHFLTMELVDGKGLDELIPSVGLKLDSIFEIAVPLADALSTAHERGIIHRDLKPANVMITDEGRVKVLDFGLAKLTGDDEEASEEDATQALTQEGKVMGTVPYMSPEQVQGKALDARSDIFSMGIILYEMATGSRPFGGDTSADLISAILRDNPASITELKGELPHHLGRVVRHCLEKDPKRRYQSALDVRNELEDLRREVHSGVVHSETVAIGVAQTQQSPTRRWLPVAGLVAALLAVTFLGWRVFAPGAGEDAPVDISPAVTKTEAPAQPSIAVLYFDNLSGDPELEWLRSGLTDMLVTDLSQSPDLRVLSTDRLYQILSDMEKLDERITSFEVVSEVAEEADADTVILGSFAKLGDTIRISIKVQEAATGEILQAESVDARVQEDIFARVDDLSRNVRQSIELPEQPVTVTDRDLTEVSTTSVEAYRAFVEGEALHYQSRELEASELYRKAAEIDPNFAMAWAKLSTTHSNLGMNAESKSYAEKAMEHLDRLTETEQAYVEGRYYGRTLETVPRAIETYESTLTRYPHATSLLNNVGVLYGQLSMLGEQIAAFEKSIAYGDRFPGTHTGLAGAYLATGDRDRAFEVLDEFLAESPESVSAYQSLAGFHLALGDLAAARRAQAKAYAIRPGFFALLFNDLSLAILEEDWAAAEGVIDQVGQLPFPFAQSARAGLSANIAAYRGDFEALPELSREAVEAAAPGNGKANALTGSAAIFLRMGEPQQALAEAQQARQEDRGNLNDFVAHGLEVVAQEQLGQSRRADLLLDELERRIEPISGPALRGWLAEVKGLLALNREDADRAVTHLEEAKELFGGLYSGQEARIWYELGEAYLLADRTTDAERTFREITDLSGTRVFNPYEYVASFYQLGTLLAERGDDAAAREAYETYLQYWGEANLFQVEIGRAKAFIAAGAGR
jgi:tetratricopeptide (TPR) repeat protein/tRNA A-37 threonylcarbamoyl transferase component Bud32